MTEEQRRGEVSAVPGGVQVRFRRSWPDPIEDVWSALTEPERVARWIGTYDGERRVGGRGTFAMTFEEGEAVGQPMTILECDPPRRLVVQLTGQEDWRLEVGLTAEGGRTQLTFSQVFAPGTDVTDYALGWHWYLDKFGAEVGGQLGPADWDSFLAEVGPAYGRPPS
jgi:uncharacterized protein YndB with AHSA1/START domain